MKNYRDNISEKKLDIWIVHPYGVTREYPASARPFEFAKELADRGHTVTCWFSSFIHPLKRYREGTAGRLVTNEKVENFLIKWIWTSSYNYSDRKRSVNLLSFFFAMLTLGLFANKPDVIIGSSPHLFAALAGALISKIKKVRFVLEIRDLWPDTFAEMNGVSKGVTLRLLYKIERYLYRTSDHVIALTEGIKESLCQKGVPGDKISFIPNGISLALEKSAPKITVSKKDLNLEGKFVCMYAGAIGQAYALENVILAVDKLSSYEDIVCVLIGEGQERLKLENLAAELGVSNVLFLGAIPKMYMPCYYLLADVFILTLKKNRIFEGALPNKVFDYLYYGRPVVCAVDGEVRRFIEETRTGIFALPEDPDALAAAILQLYFDPVTRENLSSNGRKIIEESFSREYLCDKLEQLLLKVTG